MIVSNLNKIYHKGKFRNGEWDKHLRPFAKRIGNKRFRKAAVSIEEDEFRKLMKFKKRSGRKRIKAKITVKLFGDTRTSYFRSYRNMKDLENSVKRPNVIRYLILCDEVD